MDPGEITVGVRQEIQLRLLTRPEDAKGEKAQQISHKPRRQVQQGAPQIELRMDGCGSRNMDLKNDEGHGDGKKAIAQGANPFEALTGETIVHSSASYRAIADFSSGLP